MSKLKFFTVVFAGIVALAIAGCGGDNVNGSLTVTAGAPESTDTMTSVTFAVKYTNPTKTDLINVPIACRVYQGGRLIDSETVLTTNSGAFDRGYLINRTSSDQVLLFEAKTGDIVSSDIAIIPALEPPA
jgi:hypothetical protein